MEKLYIYIYIYAEVQLVYNGQTKSQMQNCRSSSQHDTHRGAKKQKRRQLIYKAPTLRSRAGGTGRLENYITINYITELPKMLRELHI